MIQANDLTLLGWGGLGPFGNLMDATIHTYTETHMHNYASNPGHARTGSTHQRCRGWMERIPGLYFVLKPFRESILFTLLPG